MLMGYTGLQMHLYSTGPEMIHNIETSFQKVRYKGDAVLLSVAVANPTTRKSFRNNYCFLVPFKWSMWSTSAGKQLLTVSMPLHGSYLQALHIKGDE